MVGFQKDVFQSKLEMYVDMLIIYVNHVSYTMQSCEDLQRLRSCPPLESPLEDLLLVETSLCSMDVVSIVVQY